MAPPEDRLYDAGRISIHILARRMTCPLNRLSRTWIISIHILTRRMTLAIMNTLKKIKNFNPHPRIEDDVTIRDTFYDVDTFQSTSSHRGWRVAGVLVNPPRNISIHTLAQRMTHGRRRAAELDCNFNPHPRTEDDAAAMHKRQYIGFISIHIPAQRMTAPCGSRRTYKWISIHILARRMTAAAGSASGRANHFNPHPRMEDDTSVTTVIMPMNWFQSTSSHGGWHSFRNIHNDCQKISIHILAWRMTHSLKAWGYRLGISIHILAWRMTSPKEAIWW